MQTLKEVTIYTDGACSGNPGPGGYGVVLIFNGNRKEISGGFNNTTNNRMELMGVIMGLESLKEKCKVQIVSDSKYIVDAVEKGWLAKWRANGWMRTKSEEAKNSDLWKRLWDLMEHHEVRFKWVKGHSDNPENTVCDKLAVTETKKEGLPEDTRN